MDAKALVRSLMALPKAERLEKLMAMSQEAVARQQDAAPLLELIQLELDSPDDDEAPASRPVSSASSTALPPRAQPVKSMRRQLKEKRDELRAMIAKVDGALGEGSKPSTASSQRSSRPDAVAFAHMSRGEKLQLARQSGYKHAAGGAKGPAQRIEVPVHIKERFRDEYDADPEAFRKIWESQTPEFRRQCAEPNPAPTKPPTPKPPGSAQSAKSLGGRLDEAQIDALLRKAEGSKGKVGDARAGGSSLKLA